MGISPHHKSTLSEIRGMPLESVNGVNGVNDVYRPAIRARYEFLKFLTRILRNRGGDIEIMTKTIPHDPSRITTLLIRALGLAPHPDLEARVS